MNFFKKNIKSIVVFVLVVCFLLVLLLTKEKENTYIDNLYRFENGVAIVRNNGKYSLIDTKENVISKIDCDGILDTFDEGYVFVKNNKCGIVNKSGEVILEAKYDYINHFSEGLAIFEQFDKYNSIAGVINTKGEVIVEPKYSYIGTFREGLAVFSQFIENEGDLYGVINSKGEVIVEPKYDYINDFSDGLAIFEKYNENEGSMCGVINAKGEVIVEPIYDYISDFSEGLAIFEKVYKNEIVYLYDDYEVEEKDSKYGIINTKGEIVVEPKYDYISDFSEGLAIVTQKNGEHFLYGVINTKGEVVIEPKYDYINGFSEGLTLFTKYEDEYKEADELIEYTNELEVVNINNTGVMDKDGNIIIEPKYNEIHGFTNGFSVFAKYINESKVYGIVDINGNEILEGKYENMYSLNEDLYCFIENDKYGIVDNKGNIVVDAKYDYIDYFNEGIAYVGVHTARGMKVGFIDGTGKEIIPIKYNSNLLLDYEAKPICYN